MRVAAVVCVIMALAIADESKTPAFYYRRDYPELAAQVNEDLNRFCKLITATLMQTAQWLHPSMAADPQNSHILSPSMPALYSRLARW
jgi:hypothetical protein